MLVSVCVGDARRCSVWAASSCVRSNAARVAGVDGNFGPLRLEGVGPEAQNALHRIGYLHIEAHKTESYDLMNDEKITVRVTESRQTLDVVVLSKRAERIQVVLGEGVHSVRCDLMPTRNELAYAGSVMGREIVYERSREQVQADIDRLNPTLRKSTRR